MKPRYYDPMFDSAILLGVGSAHSVSDGEKPRGKLAGHLLLPDAEERHGLREWYVYRDPPDHPTRPLGFRRP